MRTPALLALAATLALAACGGGGGSSSTPSVNPTSTPGSGGPSAQSQSEAAISAANSAGDPIKTLHDFNNSTTGAMLLSRNGAMRSDALPLGQCVAVGSGANAVSLEFFSPDKNNDANSTEEQYFYDSACASLQKDVVRIFTVNGNSETVARTVNIYPNGSATASSTRTDNVTILNGTFDQYGYPSSAAGFDRSEQGSLSLAGVKTIASGDELVLAAASVGVNTFCGDSAGYNTTGIASLNETFGWQGQALSGTRTVNGDGSVTWASTHSGTSSKGAIGSLTLGAGSQNTACPIATPQFTLAGGTALGTYSIPVSATFSHGILINLVVTNATLANGNTLNVTTNTGVAPTNPAFITGAVANSGTPVATFSVDDAGDGTVTVVGTGATYTMNDWHVVK
jgi:hypothetical protein